MSTADVLQAARHAGVGVAAADGDLLLVAESPPPETLIEALRQHKSEILRLLARVPSTNEHKAPAVWHAEDWRAHFEHRAAIAQHKDGLGRNDAVVRAFERCIVEWLDCHPEPSHAGRCAWCGGSGIAGSTVVPYGTRAHTWLHPDCWPAWYQKGRRHAEATLNAFGIGAAAESPDDFGKTGRV